MSQKEALDRRVAMMTLKLGMLTTDLRELDPAAVEEFIRDREAFNLEGKSEDIKQSYQEQLACARIILQCSNRVRECTGSKAERTARLLRMLAEAVETKGER